MTGHSDNGPGGRPVGPLVGPLGRPAYGLTAGQRDCLAVIQELTAVDGRCPSYAEIAREMDLPRRSAVKGLVDGLIERGWLSRVPGRRRSLVPLLTLRLPDGGGSPGRRADRSRPRGGGRESGMTGHTDNGRWTEAEDLRLRELWRTGHTAAQSAQILSDEAGREITRSAVLGRLYRMGLSKPRVRTVPAPAPVEDGQTEDGKPDDGRTEGGGSAVRRALGMDGRIIPPPKTCQWPHGQPGTDGFHFCGSDQVVPGKPYCADHCRVAYRQPRDASAEDPAEDRAEHRVGDAA